MLAPNWTGSFTTPPWIMRSWFSVVIWRAISGGCPVRTAGLKAIPNFTASGRSTGLIGTLPAFSQLELKVMSTIKMQDF